jgi:UDP-3-O-[3-hydroxymyristoyl] N-acetylglucosamine deacetylase/3-hydroxyacyl-[acyl-carrier-protein] dehydratase
MRQRTIQKAISFHGKGLHSGKEVHITLLPQEEGFGIKFQRLDMDDKPVIEAHVSHVIDTSRGTTIGNAKGVCIKTIEHLMAAFAGCGIDNVLVQLDGEEIPILDGSSAPFVRQIVSAGIVEQEADVNVYKLKEVIRYLDQDNQIELIAIPSDDFKLSVMVDYQTKVLPAMYAELTDMNRFNEQIAPCRTFCFLHEILPLIKNNLIKGGNLDNAIVYVENMIIEADSKEIADFFGRTDVSVTPQGILNNMALRFDNEAARHKLLDLVGDMMLIGQRIQAHIIAKCPGHLSNFQFAKLIAEQIKKDKNSVCFHPAKPSLLTMEEIKNLLPHRPPFLLIDKIIELESERIVGVKNVTMNEPFFVGHFPDKPVMPGVLIMEGLAQTGGILVLKQVPDPENYLTYFLKMNNVRWRQQVIPGDTLIYEMVLLEPVRWGLVHMFGKAYVDNKLVAEGDLLAQIVREKETQ